MIKKNDDRFKYLTDSLSRLSYKYILRITVLKIILIMKTNLEYDFENLLLAQITQN